MTAFLLPFALTIHTLGYYAARSSVWQHASALGAPVADIRDLLTFSVVAMACGALLSAGVGAVAGPLPTLILAMLASAAGSSVIAASSGMAGLSLGLAIVSVAAGALHRALQVGLAREFGRGWESARTAVLLLAYGGVNLAALPSGFLSVGLREVVGDEAGRAVFAGSAALTLLAAGLAAGLLWFGWSTVRAEDRRLHGPTLAVVAVTVGVGGVALSAWEVAFGVQTELITQSFSSSLDGAWIYSINPAVVLITSILAALGLGVAQALKVAVPGLAVAGLGGLLCAVALVPTVTLGEGEAGIALLVGLVVVGAIGEPLLWAGLLSRVTGEVDVRLTLVAAALLGVAGYSGGTVRRALGELLEGPAGAVAASGLGGVLGVTGVLMLIAAWPVRSWLGSTSMDDDDSPAPPSGVDPYGFDAR